MVISEEYEAALPLNHDVLTQVSIKYNFEESGCGSILCPCARH